MDPLEDLCARLKTQAAAGMGMRAYLYAERGSERLRHGRIFLHRDGRCIVECEGMDGDAALQALREMGPNRLVTLLDTTLIQPAAGIPCLRVEAVLSGLGVSGPAAEPMHPVASAAAVAAVAEPVPAIAPERAEARPAAPPVALLVERTRRLLEEFLGGSAARRLQEIAQRFPPAEQPAAFLVAAETQLSMMVGGRKAAEVFEPLRQEWGL
jgi:hypothetical protein